MHWLWVKNIELFWCVKKNATSLFANILTIKEDRNEKIKYEVSFMYRNFSIIISFG